MLVEGIRYDASRTKQHGATSKNSERGTVVSSQISDLRFKERSWQFSARAHTASSVIRSTRQAFKLTHDHAHVIFFILHDHMQVIEGREG